MAMTSGSAQSAILRRLLTRRTELQKTLDDTLASPQSYSIQGSYSQTARSVVELQQEIARLDDAIRAMSSSGGPIRKSYPRYIAP